MDMKLRLVVLGLLIVISLISDFRTYKIKNSITFSFIFIGIGIGIYENVLKEGRFFEGIFEGGRFSIIAVLLPVILLLPLFALRMLGAGDIKLFSAIGAIMGTGFVLKAMMYSFFAGGIIALLTMLFRRNLKGRLIYFFNYLQRCFLSASIMHYTDLKDKSDGAKLRFTYAIAVGTMMGVMGTLLNF